MKANHRVVPRGENTIKRYKSHVPYQWPQRREHKSSAVHASPNSNSLHIICRSVEGKMQLYELDSVLSPSVVCNPMLSHPAHRRKQEAFSQCTQSCHYLDCTITLRLDSIQFLKTVPFWALTQRVIFSRRKSEISQFSSCLLTCCLNSQMANYKTKNGNTVQE